MTERLTGGWRSTERVDGDELKQSEDGRTRKTDADGWQCVIASHTVTAPEGSSGD